MEPHPFSIRSQRSDWHPGKEEKVLELLSTTGDKHTLSRRLRSVTASVAGVGQGGTFPDTGMLV